MSTPNNLTPDQKEYLGAIAMTLNNLDFATLIARVVCEYQKDNAWPEATIHFEGKPPFRMRSGNCFVVALPVLNMAALDCRRAVEFFGLMFDQEQDPPALVSLSSKKRKRRPDDIGIEHFGLLEVAPKDFLDVTKLDEPTLWEVYERASKQLAHFTNTELKFDPQKTQRAARGIIEAFHVLLYNALGEPQPEMLLKVVSAKKAGTEVAQ